MADGENKFDETVNPSNLDLTTVDGTPLKVALANAQRRARYRALFLVLPLLLFVLVTFLAPITQMLFRSVHNPSFSDHSPNLSKWFDENPAGTEPDETAFEALVQDLRSMRAAKTMGIAGTRINYEHPGSRSLFTSTARKSEKIEAPFKAAVVEANAKWDDPVLWEVMRRASSAYTVDFYLAALDRTRDIDGKIIAVDEDRRIYAYNFLKTLLLAGLITVGCLILAYPVAHLLATLPLRQSNLLMIFVLLPFWTSLLVRTTSWIVLLQSQGVLNDTLVATGVVADESRIQMIYNQTGTIIAMIHILLPFMILPLYSVMRPINPSYVRAARSLGATSWTAFRRIYLPQTIPGMGAGGLLVFILGVGYYITPALVGGASGQLISNFIAFHMQKSLNWSLAAALATLLLLMVLVLYWLYDRLVGIDNLKLG